MTEQPDRHRRPPLVLMVNDHEWSTRALESVLAPNGYAVLRAFTARKGIERAEASHPDLIVLDTNLPDMDGVDVCRHLRSGGLIARNTPIILTTAGHPSRHERMEALRAGAWEFLSHPIDAEELLLRIDHYIAAKQETDDSLEGGLLDAATNLYNVRGLARRAREIAAAAARNGSSLACVVFSTRGPEDDDAGADELAQRVAELLSATGRGGDAIGRLGPGEFAVFAPQTDDAGARAFAVRISDAIGKQPNGGGPRLRAGYAASGSGTDHIRPGDLLDRASQAVHTARRSAAVEWLARFEPEVSRS